jgi:hypothetical protein
MSDQYLTTGDESRIVYDQIFSKMLALDRDHVETIVGFTHENRETMVTVFAGVNGIGLVKISPEGTKRTSEFFKDQIRQESYPRSLPVGGSNVLAI